MLILFVVLIALVIPFCFVFSGSDNPGQAYFAFLGIGYLVALGSLLIKGHVIAALMMVLMTVSFIAGLYFDLWCIGTPIGIVFGVLFIKAAQDGV